MADQDRLTEDEKAELERLRAIVTAVSARRSGRRSARWRVALGTVLIVIGCLLAPLAVIGVWANNQVSNTERYVANIAPLASNPAIQNAITNRVTREIASRLDLNGLVGTGMKSLDDLGLPPRVSVLLQGLTPSIVDGVESFIRKQVAAVVHSEQFRQAWVTANEAAHAELNRVLTGESKTIQLEGDTVSLDLGPIIELAKQRLSDAGLTAVDRIPAIHPRFEVFQSAALVRARPVYIWLDRLAWLQPILSIGLIVLGVLVAPARRKAVVGAAVGVAISMLLLAAGLAIARWAYLGALPAHTDAGAAAVLFDVMVRFVKAGVRTVMVVAVIVALGGWLAGTSTAATRIRGGVSRGIARLRFGDPGPVGAWVHTYRTGLRIAVVSAAAIVFIFWDRPSGKVAVLLAVVVVVLLAVIEFVARPRPVAPD